MLPLLSAPAMGLAAATMPIVQQPRVPAVSMVASANSIKQEQQIARLKKQLALARSGDADAETITLDARTARIAIPAGAAATITSLAALAPPDSNPIASLVQEAWAETSRKSKIDPRAEAAMERYYPKSLGSLTMDRLVSTTLNKYGYTRDNTLFATSTCPDEVNSKPGEIIDLFKNRYGENFALGGLGGIPFTGRAGFSAYAHHVAKNGKMFIVFAPHVGVEFDGAVGALKRVNQDEISTACGAAVGAFKAIMKEKEKAKAEGVYGVAPGVDEYFDAQINFIKLKLAARLKEVDSAPSANAFTSYQMYALVREYFIDELLTAPGFWDIANEVAVLGGLMINRGKGGDRFMPLMFQKRKSYEGSVVDMYEDTFGPPPREQMKAVLGDSMLDLFNYDLDVTSAEAMPTPMPAPKPKK